MNSAAIGLNLRQAVLRPGGIDRIRSAASRMSRLSVTHARRSAQHSQKVCAEGGGTDSRIPRRRRGATDPDESGPAMPRRTTAWLTIPKPIFLEADPMAC